jgi:hypothetical protein
VHRRHDPRFVAHVDRLREDATPELGERSRGFGILLLAATPDHDRTSRTRDAPREAETDAGVAAAHHDDLVGQLEHGLHCYSKKVFASRPAAR